MHVTGALPWHNVSNKCLTLPFPSFSRLAAGLLRFALVLLADTVGMRDPAVAVITVFLRHVNLCLKALALAGAFCSCSLGCCICRPKHLENRRCLDVCSGALLYIQQEA